MPSLSSSCFCGLPALSCAGGAPPHARGSRPRSSELLATAMGGRGFNKARLKVGDILLLCCLLVISLPLAGRGGEGLGWGFAVKSGAGGFCGVGADSGRFLPPHLLAEGQLCWSSSSSALGATSCVAVPAILLAEGQPPLVAMIDVGRNLQPPGLVPFRRPCCSVVVVVCHGALTVPSGFVPGGDEVDCELPEGPVRVPQFVLVVLLVSLQGPVCNFLSCVGPIVSNAVSLAKF